MRNALYVQESVCHFICEPMSSQGGKFLVTIRRPTARTQPGDLFVTLTRAGFPPDRPAFHKQ